MNIYIRRFAAYLVDIVLNVFLFTLYCQLFGHKNPNGSYNLAGRWSIIILGASTTLYYSLMEYWLGQTIGKLIMRLKVVKIDGSPLTLMDGFKRNAFDLIELIVIPIIPIISILATTDHRRVGDFLAGTIVIPKTGLLHPHVQGIT